MTSTTPLNLTLIRHGALDDTLNGHYIGRLNPPLSENGHQQAQALAMRLNNQHITQLWCSPTLRAQQTAFPIAKQLQVLIQTNTLLQEVNFGSWEGLTFEQMQHNDPELVNQWANNEPDFRFPDGESTAEFHQRIDKIAQQIQQYNEQAVEQCSSTHLVLITHGGVIRALICQLLTLPRNNYLKFEIKRGGYATLTLTGQHAVLTGLYNNV